VTAIPAQRTPLATAALARVNAAAGLITTGDQMRELDRARLPIPTPLVDRYAGLLAAYDTATAEVRRLTGGGAA
jgi:hypothetical protein